jgi:hypothetical protein
MKSWDMELPMTYRYKGRPLEELTKEELIEAVGVAVRQYEGERESRNSEREMMKLFRKRGI